MSKLDTRTTRTMFYCEECKNKNQWPGLWPTSFGECEVCDKRRPCYDVPSSALPTPNEKPFDVAIDHAKRVITIQGVRYAFDLFDYIGFAAEGTVFRIGEREDGCVTLYAVFGANE